MDGFLLLCIEKSLTLTAKISTAFNWFDTERQKTSPCYISSRGVNLCLSINFPCSKLAYTNITSGIGFSWIWTSHFSSHFFRCPMHSWDNREVSCLLCSLQSLARESFLLSSLCIFKLLFVYAMCIFSKYILL